MQTDDIINDGFLVQKALREYRNIVDSKRWEPTDSKKTFKYDPLLVMNSNVVMEDPVNKTVDKFYCKNRHKGK